ncbi:porin family protein [Vibrio hangzhouensis]|uniref:porin family protein n=1 Tax=Vibrio hangzhouensis TaxID=462991 RepID=UPI001C9862E0|nr:porin family protein [Vibrio hangzhouensis]MBY6197331.1 porin family protein [Vibrio hangzhouensis]
MVRLILLKLLVCLSFAPSISLASERSDFEKFGYLGVGYSYVNAELEMSEKNSESFDNSMVGIIVGYQFHKNMGVELRGYGNVKDDKILELVDVKFNHQFGIYLKPTLPVAKYFTLYGLLGYADLKATASFEGGSDSDNDQDVQYGIGISVNKATPLELQVEWLQLYDDSGLEASGINLNLVYKL